MSLRMKASLLFATIIAVVLGSTGFFFLRFLETSLRSSIYAGVEGVSSTSAEAVSKFLEGSLREVQAVAHALPIDALEGKDRVVVEDRLKNLLAIFPKFENGMFLLDADGVLWADYPPHPDVRGKNFSFRQYFKQTIEEERGIVGVPYRSARTGEPVLTFTAPLRGSSSQVVGILGCSVQLLSSTALGSIQRTKIGESGYVYIYDKTRLMILHPHEDRVLKRDVPRGINKLFDAAIGGFEGAGETVNSRGIPMLLSLRQIPNTNWIIGAQQPKREAFAPIARARGRILVWMLVAVMAAGLVAALAIQRITKPLAKLRDAVVQLIGESSGREAEIRSQKADLVKELEAIKGGDEIGELALTFKDMSQRLEHTMGALTRSANEWRRTVDSVPDAIFILDENLRIQRLNRSAARLWNVEFKEAIGRHCYELMHGTDSPPGYCPHQGTLSTGKQTAVEADEPLLQKVFEMTVTPIVKDGRGINGTVHVARDITQRKRAHEALKESEEKYRGIFENSVVGLFQSTPQGRFISVNPTMARMLGYASPEELVSSISDIATQLYVNPQERQRCQQLIGAMGHVENYKFKVRRRDNSQIWVSESTRAHVDQDGDIILYEGIVIDITEQKKLEEQLRRSQKMESIGNLAGGIAHDFNNLLFPIVGFAELLQEDLHPGSQEYENAREILEAGKRGRDLVKQILAFSRQSERQTKPVRLQQIVTEVLKLGRSTIPANIEIAQHLQSDCGFVMADPTQLHQIAMNLITNAYHAVETTGGEISIQLMETMLGSDDLADTSLEPGHYVRLSVFDTGCGIEPAQIDKIFEPYFTTKEQGKGTGLGLAVVYGIVKEYHGEIKVYSEVGKGTAFHVYLPLMKKSCNEAVSIENMQNYRSDNEQILLVDDEEANVRLIKRNLEHLGYRVTARVNSLEALEAFRANPDAFDLVFTDMTMPNMTGTQLANELTKIRPDIPILLCTGFSECISRDSAEAVGIKGFLMKPVAKSELAYKVREVLDAVKRPAPEALS